LQLSEADLLRREENYQQALDIYQALEKLSHTSWFTEHQGQVIYGIGNSYIQMSRPHEAMNYFSKALDIYTVLKDQSRVGTIFSRLGEIHQRLGELDKAAEYYEKSLTIHRKLGNHANYADALNSRGNIYRLQGQYEEALLRSTVAQRIRESEFLEFGGSVSEIGIGLSLSSIGNIYLKIGDLQQSQKFFEDAFEIYNRNRYKKGIAATYNRFGQVAVEKSEFKQAMNYFEKAYRNAVGIDADTEITSLNKQGSVLIQQGNFEEAIPLLEEARKQAQQISSFYQQAESLVDLANAFDKSGQHDKANQMLQEAEEIATPYNYYYLLGLIENIRAERGYLADNYQAAFQKFGKFCYYMERYNPVEYEKAVRKTIKQLLTLHGREFESRWNDLHSFWLALNLQEKSSQMLHELEEVKELMSI